MNNKLRTNNAECEILTETLAVDFYYLAFRLLFPNKDFEKAITNRILLLIMLEIIIQQN